MAPEVVALVLVIAVGFSLSVASLLRKRYESGLFFSFFTIVSLIGLGLSSGQETQENSGTYTASLSEDYGDSPIDTVETEPSIEQRFHSRLAAYDILLVQKYAFVGANRVAPGVYLRAGQTLQEAITILEQDGRCSFGNYIRPAELARGFWKSRYEQFKLFQAPQLEPSGQDWRMIAGMAESYGTVMDRGFGEYQRTH